MFTTDGRQLGFAAVGIRPTRVHSGLIQDSLAPAEGQSSQAQWPTDREAPKVRRIGKSCLSLKIGHRWNRYHACRVVLRMTPLAQA